MGNKLLGFEASASYALTAAVSVHCSVMCRRCHSRAYWPHARKDVASVPHERWSAAGHGKVSRR